MDAKVKVKPELKIIKEPIPHLLIPGEMGAVLELTVKDKDGKVTDHRIMKSKSYVRQFLELLWCEIYALTKAQPQSIRDTSNVLKNMYGSAGNMAADEGAGDASFGIIVGTGTTAPNISDYAIETLIAHGGGGGQLQYGAVTFGAPASDATTSQLTITRDFANASGGDITVNEIALYLEAMDTSPAMCYFLAIRDVIAVGILVPNGQTLTVNYREQVVV